MDSLVQDFSEDYVFVSNGEISHPTKEELQSSFRIYLNSTAFTDYRDLSEPIIGISEDGSVAWTIVKVKVAGSQIRDDGSKRDFDVTYAWITLFKQQGGKWKRLIEVSTDNQKSDE